MPQIFLIPTLLAEEAVHTLPPYVMEQVRQCSLLFVEHERTARRFLKRMDPTLSIEAFSWHTLGEDETVHHEVLAAAFNANRHVAVLSEAGCPGVADPGQGIIRLAQQMGFTVSPLVGPSSILLALMGSGMNGQCFTFHGYLPIDPGARAARIRELESLSARNGSTHIFIETPYRNRALLDALLQQCRSQTRLCIASELTSPRESIRTRTMEEWKKDRPELHKIPVLFLLQA